MQVILADSNDLVRLGLRTILNAHGGFEIVGDFRLPDQVFKLMKPEYRGMFLLKRAI